MSSATVPDKRTAKDFASDQEIRWCPGCGDYAILKAVQRTLADLGVPKEKTVFVSGIGCSSRFPYYMSTYGFHTIHGRAPAIGTGVKVANPDLDIWIVTGDGDGLSIGGNHTIHALRRNIDLQILLFNNEIYGLTKGQYSPTSRAGTVSPSTPHGSFETPMSPGALALGAGARFVARSVDTMQKHLVETLTRAHGHRGTSFVEIFQNCLVFNDGVFSDFTEKSVASDNQIHLEHGRPLMFGTLASMLVGLCPPAFPQALGVIYCNPGPTYEENVREQITAAKTVQPAGDLNTLIRAGKTWEVKG
jgi:2-oxoglutarate ferredoxin oxidoreductase subunit beta